MRAMFELILRDFTVGSLSITLCSTCFHFISTTTKERKHNFEKLLDQKFGPAPLKNDEKARLKAEYETLSKCCNDPGKVKIKILGSRMV